MLTRAARTHGLDLAGSWIIGDTLDDIEAGHRAGCRTALLLSGHGIVPSADAPASPLRTPHLKSADWLVISQRILADTISPLQSDLSHVREIPRAPAWTPPFVSC
jgi:histidinol phosphatase-like enzyme